MGELQLQSKPFILDNIVKKEFSLLDTSFLHEERDATTILDDSIWCYKFRRRSKETVIRPLQCVELGTAKVQLFHIGGLLPIDHIRSCSILCPSQGDNGNSWGIRKLSTNEIYNCLDMDLEITRKYKQLPWFDFDTSNLVPAKLWLGAVAHLTSLDEAKVIVSPKRQRISLPPPPRLGREFRSLFSSLGDIQQNQTAVKADDAETNVQLWSMHLFNGGGSLFRHVKRTTSPVVVESALVLLRDFCLIWWKRHLVRGFIRDGIASPFVREPPTYMKPQRRVEDKQRHHLVCEKLSTVLRKGYIGPGPIRSLTAFFDVPKGGTDIRMVYDGTINGFNDSIEVPKFGMPTLKSHLRAMGPSYHMVDADVGECFLNFYLHPSLQPYVGVDLSHFVKNVNGNKHNWMCWHRAGMGLKSSPYQACQGMMVAEEVMLGDRKDKNNPFRWDEVRINLPGMESYDPTLPWVSKIRLSDGNIAADVFIYMDDLRITGMTREEAWQACHGILTILCW